LRQDYDQFTVRGAEILALGPDGPRAFQRYWEQEGMPFPGLADIHSRVAAQYEQEVNLLKFGRMPAMFVIDRQGRIRYSHYGESMQDIPPTQAILDVLDSLNREPPL
jgi:peroxiredoxin Q/BCP